MTYKIYFIEKTRAQLCHSVHTTTEATIKDGIVETGIAWGFEVRVEQEE